MQRKERKTERERTTDKEKTKTKRERTTDKENTKRENKRGLMTLESEQ